MSLLTDERIAELSIPVGIDSAHAKLIGDAIRQAVREAGEEAAKMAEGYALVARSGAAQSDPVPFGAHIAAAIRERLV